jgi:hypothetical protein
MARRLLDNRQCSRLAVSAMERRVSVHACVRSGSDAIKTDAAGKAGLHSPRDALTRARRTANSD